ncbi:myosin-11 [Battus philenor]|uniref:myosin-11 n=1 Tax=Battus philenor TaxID=42288 RepID=UPI0035CF4D34
MGNIFSTVSTSENLTGVCQVTMADKKMVSLTDAVEKDIDELQDTESDDDDRARRKEAEMVEFRKQLNLKREQRKEILLRHRNEKKELEKSLDKQIKSNLELTERNKMLRELLMKNNIDIPEGLERIDENSNLTKTILLMKEEFETLKTNNNKLRCELATTNNALQAAYSDIATLSEQNTESIKQIKSLKEVVTVSKTLINLREEQLNELKNKLNEIEQSLADRETHMLSTDLRQEYERQLQNIRTLRGLYEERARLAEVTRQALIRELQEQKELNKTEVNKRNDLNAKIDELESTVNTLEETIKDKNDQISSWQEETRGLKAEMEVVNKLFSQVLLGYTTRQDLDKLVNRLEENHGILTHMAERENGSEASSALPKLLLQLISQVEEIEEHKQSGKEQKEEVTAEERSNEDKNDNQNSENNRAEEIVQNLPKVWRVLTELLSHQTVSEVETPKVTTCYKSVETKSGPVLVPSVSQTYIRLKDLIIEKLTLIKEVNRMKQLNGHLETRLQEQERRLCLVTTELSKTWHVVGRLRRHHHQLHTHEKILKYELQQKRKLLNELKEELEYCREKWEQAREKNSQSEKDWKKLRAEFSSRKVKSMSTSINNSAESGYSDERPSDDSSESNDESEYIKEPQVRCKKKVKKTFEAAVDSSVDFNLAAEKEDPSSDTMDIADLPLDNPEPEPLRECSSLEELNKYQKTYVATEDEVVDLASDSCLEESSIAKHFEDTSESCVKDFKNVSCNSKENMTSDVSIYDRNVNPEKDIKIEGSINPVEILNVSYEQNKEKSSGENKNFEISTNDYISAESVIKTDSETDNASNNVFNIPTTSQQHNNLVCESQSKLSLNLNEEQKSLNKDGLVDGSSSHEQFDHTQNLPVSNNKNAPGPLDPCIDFKAILENIKKQNEHLQSKENRLQNLENGCTSVIDNLTNTLQTGELLTDKLQKIHSQFDKKCDNESQTCGSEVVTSDIDLKSTEYEQEPSTSNEMDHEAMFAARDMRLKRLEEQTKSLVNKVNKTATKGVKLNYKLEELHNIYGSDTSRAGTPSEDNEGSPQDNSPDGENNKEQ